MKQNMFTHLYGLDQFEQKNYKDLYQRAKQFQSLMKNQKKFSNLHNKNIITNQIHFKDHQSSPFKAFICYDKIVMPNQCNKYSILKNSRQRQLRIKANSKQKQNNLIKNLLKNRCKSVLQRHRNNSFFNTSKNFRNLQNQKIEIKGLRQKMSQQQLLTIDSRKNNRSDIPSPKLKAYYKTIGELSLKRTRTRNKPNLDTGNYKKQKFKINKRTSQIQVNPWNFHTGQTQMLAG